MDWELTFLNPGTLPHRFQADAFLGLVDIQVRTDDPTRQLSSFDREHVLDLDSFSYDVAVVCPSHAHNQTREDQHSNANLFDDVHLLTMLQRNVIQVLLQTLQEIVWKVGVLRHFERKHDQVHVLRIDAIAVDLGLNLPILTVFHSELCDCLQR